MLVVRQLLHEDGLPLPPHPAAALLGTDEVDGAVAVAVHHRGVLVGELVRVLEGLGRGDPGAVQAVGGHAGWREIVDQLLCVATHGQAVSKINVSEELSVVTNCIVETGRLDQDLEEGRGELNQEEKPHWLELGLFFQVVFRKSSTEQLKIWNKVQHCKHFHPDLIFGPCVVVGKQPGGGDGSALLAANLHRVDHRDAVVVTCVQGKESGPKELKINPNISREEK